MSAFSRIPQQDIQVYKAEIRNKYLLKRNKMPESSRKPRNKRIFQYLSEMWEYQAAGLVLSYVSMGSEISTRDIIDDALSKGKTVAVPYCIPGTKDMDFYKISSVNELKEGSFGILEPEPEETRRITEYSNSICILPGLVFDRYGYRIGYGGGYYDRFLADKYSCGQNTAKVGICYSSLVRLRLKTDKYDIPADYVVTDYGVKKAMKTSTGKPKK